MVEATGSPAGSSAASGSSNRRAWLRDATMSVKYREESFPTSSFSVTRNRIDRTAASRASNRASTSSSRQSAAQASAPRQSVAAMDRATYREPHPRHNFPADSGRTIRFRRTPKSLHVVCLSLSENESLYRSRPRIRHSLILHLRPKVWLPTLPGSPKNGIPLMKRVACAFPKRFQVRLSLHSLLRPNRCVLKSLNTCCCQWRLCFRFMCSMHRMNSGDSKLPEKLELRSVDLTLPPKSLESLALEKIGQLGGGVERDNKLPDNPVVGVSLDLFTQFGDQHACLLKVFKDLKSLNLNRTHITDSGLKELSELKDLTTLGLGNTAITDAGLRELKGFKNLTTLDLGEDNHITDKGLKELRELRNLTTLTLGGLEITEACIKDLSELKNLAELDLTLVQITDAGLKELREIKSITSLKLRCITMTDHASEGVGRVEEPGQHSVSSERQLPIQA